MKRETRHEAFAPCRNRPASTASSLVAAEDAPGYLRATNAADAENIAVGTRAALPPNLLGRVWHEFPPAPNGLQWEMEKHEWNLVQIRDYKERAA